MDKYHITNNSFYIQILRVRYSNEEYIKCHIMYFYKTSGLPFFEEKNVKIMRSVMKYWETWKESQ